MKDLGLTPRHKATNALVDVASSVLGAVHMGASIIADTSYLTEQKLYRNYYRNQDGSKLTEEQLRIKGRDRYLKTDKVKAKLGIPEIDVQSLFEEA